MVVLLQALLGLCDEGARTLQTLSAVRDLLGQLAQLHHLKRHTHMQTNEILRTPFNHLLTLRRKTVIFGVWKVKCFCW